MNRRSLGRSALYCAALLVGAAGAVSVPSVFAKSPANASHSSQQAPSAVPEPAVAPAKKAPPVVCKTTKDCPQDQICGKVNDHKECTPPLVQPPKYPVVT